MSPGRVAEQVMAAAKSLGVRAFKNRLDPAGGGSAYPFLRIDSRRLRDHPHRDMGLPADARRDGDRERVGIFFNRAIMSRPSLMGLLALAIIITCSPNNCAGGSMATLTGLLRAMDFVSRTAVEPDGGTGKTGQFVALRRVVEE